MRRSDQLEKVHVLIVSHGGLAPEILASARRILGRDLEGFCALPLDWSDGIDEGEKKVSAALQRFGRGIPVLILTDIFGGTPSNVANRFLDPGRVEVVSGVNLAMVVRLGCLQKKSLQVDQLAVWIQDKGRSSICNSSQLPRVEGVRASQGNKTQHAQPEKKPIPPRFCEDTNG